MEISALVGVPWYITNNAKDCPLFAMCKPLSNPPISPTARPQIPPNSLSYISGEPGRLRRDNDVVSEFCETCGVFEGEYG